MDEEFEFELLFTVVVVVPVEEAGNISHIILPTLIGVPPPLLKKLLRWLRLSEGRRGIETEEPLRGGDVGTGDDGTRGAGDDDGDGAESIG